MITAVRKRSGSSWYGHYSDALSITLGGGAFQVKEAAPTLHVLW